MTLPVMVQRLQRKVDIDWEGSTVVVSATDQAYFLGDLEAIYRRFIA